MSMNKEIEAAVDAYLEAHEIKFKFYRIPARPNSTSFSDPDWKGIHWNVGIARKGRLVNLEFSEGIGHFVKQVFGRRFNTVVDNALEKVVLSGKCPVGVMLTRDDYSRLTDRVKRTVRGVVINAPHPASVLSCTVLDYQGLKDSFTYEQWAELYGYDEDSRKGEAIYKECRDQAARLERVLGEHHIMALAEIVNEY